MSAPSATAIWQRCHKRSTPRRTAVLESLLALDAQRGGATAIELYEHLRLQDASVSLTGIYKTLRELIDGEAVECHHVGPRLAVFALRHDQQRLHLVCTECQSIQYLSGAAPNEPLLALARSQGFSVADATVTLRGRCLACARPAFPTAKDVRID